MVIGATGTELGGVCVVAGGSVPDMTEAVLMDKVAGGLGMCRYEQS